MRVEFLFFRWLLAIAVVAFGLVYAGSSHFRPPPPAYQTIPLTQGGRSAGLPLAGIAVDPNQRDVYAVVGGPAGKEGAQKFYIVWKGKGGETYGTAFPIGGGAAEGMFEVLPDGQIRTVPKEAVLGAADPVTSSDRTRGSEVLLRSLVEALPLGSAP